MTAFPMPAEDNDAMPSALGDVASVLDHIAERRERAAGPSSRVVPQRRVPIARPGDDRTAPKPP